MHIHYTGWRQQQPPENNYLPMNFEGQQQQQQQQQQQRPDASLSFDSGHSVAHLRDPFAPAAAAAAASASPILPQLNHYEIQVDGVERHTYGLICISFEYQSKAKHLQ